MPQHKRKFVPPPPADIPPPPPEDQLFSTPAPQAKVPEPGLYDSFKTRLDNFLTNFKESFGAPEKTSDIIEGPAYMIKHPVDASGLLLEGMAKSQQEVIDQAYQEQQHPSPLKKIRGLFSGINASIPLIGPVMQKAGNQFSAGDIEGGAGTMSGIASQIAIGARSNLATSAKYFKNRPGEIIESIRYPNAARMLESPPTAELIPAEQLTRLEVDRMAAKHGVIQTSGEALQSAPLLELQEAGGRSLVKGGQVQKMREQNVANLSGWVNEFAERLDPESKGATAEAFGKTVDLGPESSKTVYSPLGGKPKKVTAPSEIQQILGDDPTKFADRIMSSVGNLNKIKEAGIDVRPLKNFVLRDIANKAFKLKEGTLAGYGHDVLSALFTPDELREVYGISKTGRNIKFSAEEAKINLGGTLWQLGALSRLALNIPGIEALAAKWTLSPRIQAWLKGTKPITKARPFPKGRVPVSLTPDEGTPQPPRPESGTPPPPPAPRGAAMDIPPRAIGAKEASVTGSTLPPEAQAQSRIHLMEELKSRLRQAEPGSEEAATLTKMISDLEEATNQGEGTVDLGRRRFLKTAAAAPAAAVVPESLSIAPEAPANPNLVDVSKVVDWKDTIKNLVDEFTIPGIDSYLMDQLDELNDIISSESIANQIRYNIDVAESAKKVGNLPDMLRFLRDNAINIDSAFSPEVVVDMISKSDEVGGIFDKDTISWAKEEVRKSAERIELDRQQDFASHFRNRLEENLSRLEEQGAERGSEFENTFRERLEENLESAPRQKKPLKREMEKWRQEQKMRNLEGETLPPPESPTGGIRGKRKFQPLRQSVLDKYRKTPGAAENLEGIVSRAASASEASEFVSEGTVNRMHKRAQRELGSEAKARPPADSRYPTGLAESTGSKSPFVQAKRASWLSEKLEKEGIDPRQFRDKDMRYKWDTGAELSDKEFKSNVGRVIKGESLETKLRESVRVGKALSEGKSFKEALKQSKKEKK